MTDHVDRVGVIEDDRILLAGLHPDALDELAADGRMVSLDAGIDDRHGDPGSVGPAERGLPIHSRRSGSSRSSRSRRSPTNGSLQAGR